MKDFLGRELTVGARVVYPTRAGSSCWLREGTINSLPHALAKAYTVQVRTVASNGRVFLFWAAPSRLVVVP